ncbi:MAG: 3-oxoacyl-[acyl-carrier-protein] synthase III C-terminal domain-containing protein [Cloacibacillus evryensis]
MLHQGNTRIIDSLFKRLGVSTDRTLIGLENYGNTSPPQWWSR